MNFQKLITDELNQAAAVLGEFVANPENLQNIESAAALFSTALKNDHKIYSCGNGGSHCDAMHFAEELSGRFRDDRKALAAMAISDSSHITCVGNDYGFDQIFSRHVEAFGQPGDVLLAISTSGNSSNVLKACNVARTKKMKVVALTGNDGGKLASLADVEIRAPHSGYADRIQEIHIKVIHALILLIEKSL